MCLRFAHHADSPNVRAARVDVTPVDGSVCARECTRPVINLLGNTVNRNTHMHLQLGVVIVVTRLRYHRCEIPWSNLCGCCTRAYAPNTVSQCACCTRCCCIGMASFRRNDNVSAGTATLDQCRAGVYVRDIRVALLM